MLLAKGIWVEILNISYDMLKGRLLALVLLLIKSMKDNVDIIRFDILLRT